MFKKNVLPWELPAGYGLSNFFPVKILRFASQILGFSLWHPPKILRSTRQSVPTPHIFLRSFYIKKNYIRFIAINVISSACLSSVTQA